MSDRDVIILLTPIHTGTHFVRMLLESHPSVAPAVEEDYRVDRKFRPNYVLAENGKGSRNDDQRKAEPMILEYFRNFLNDVEDGQKFRQVLEYWHTISASTIHPHNNHDFHLKRVTRAFRELGIQLEPKSEEFLFYRGHAHREYLAYDLSKLRERFRLVVAIRHPLATVTTILRRHPAVSWNCNVEDYLSALQCIFSLPNAFVFCTDLWQGTPEKMESLFSFLGLQPADATKHYLSLRPKINKTIARHELPFSQNFAVEHDHSLEVHAVLTEAKKELQNNRLHPCLAPYWQRIRSLELIQSFEKHGYRFEF